MNTPHNNIREDASMMLEAVIEHMNALDELKAIAARHDGVLPDTFRDIIEDGPDLGINTRLYFHALADSRIAATVNRFADERIPLYERIERLDDLDAPLTERIEAKADLMRAFVRVLSPLAGN